MSTHLPSLVRIAEDGGQAQGPTQEDPGGDIGEQLYHRCGADGPEHRLPLGIGGRNVFVLRSSLPAGGDVAASAPRGHRAASPMATRYWSTGISRSSSRRSSGCTTIIQPLPYGSEFTTSGESTSAGFTSTTVPLRGAYRSDTAFTDSTTPNGCMDVTFAPTAGSSTNTTSVRRSAANLVIPTRTRPPSTRTHSCSLEYRRSFGYILAPQSWKVRELKSRRVNASGASTLQLCSSTTLQPLL